MKISHMLKREDFYSINEKTLKSYFINCIDTKKLFVYPNLNVILCSNPSSTVKKYIYTEYSVNGSIIKRIAVKIYCFFLLNSHGIFASKRITIPNNMTSERMIYPCNRKYRIFDFSKNKVDVIVKDGFSDDFLKNEIKFRLNNKADFIPELIDVFANGYSEKIIDGFPAARGGKKTMMYAEKAYALLFDFISNSLRKMKVDDYFMDLQSQYLCLIHKIRTKNKDLSFNKINEYFSFLAKKINGDDTIIVSLSHGDLQLGNIWIENGTGKIFIIDWESAKERSILYDKAVLFNNLRIINFLKVYANHIDSKKAIILVEDLLFKLEEIDNLPFQYGKDDFESYLFTVLNCINN